MSETDNSGRSLVLDGISAYHGPVPAVRNVSLDLKAGEAVGVVGPNGAGKSTLLLAIAGFLRTTGEMSSEGARFEAARSARRRREGIALVPQERAVIADLDLKENLRLSWLTGRRSLSWDESLDSALEIFPALSGRLHEPAGNLSGGQRQMLAVARGLTSCPSVLMLDEPTAGLAPKFIAELAEAFIALRAKSGLTLLLVEQNLSVVEKVCDRLHVLTGGQIIWEGSADSVDRARIGALYAGSADPDHTSQQQKRTQA